MKDTVSERLATEFRELCGDLIESLRGTFPSCEVLAGYCDAVEAELATDVADVAARAVALLNAPVPKKSTKYDRAVQSITGAPLNVYQALLYRDAAAAQGTHPHFADVDLPSKIATLSASDASIFWKYVEEIATVAYRVTRARPPPVPTSEQIARDIQTRRSQRDRVVQSNATTGMDEMWREVCLARGVAATPVDDALRARLSAHMATGMTSEKMCAHFPELGRDEYDAPCLALVERLANLCVMNQAIPSNMMRGIERVASQLMSGIQDGSTDLANLDVEKIGQQVLNDVAEDDVGEFAKNLDKILPALQGMGHTVE